MIRDSREEIIKKLKLTLIVCEHNVDVNMLKVTKMRKRLETAQSELAERRESLAKVEDQIRDFYGGLEGNVILKE